MSKTQLNGQMSYQALTLTEVLKRARKMRAQTHIVTHTPSGQVHQYTYADFYQRVCQLAHALVGTGIQKGDRVGTLAWNTYEHLELYFSIPCVGAVVHTLNLRLSCDQLAYVINHAEDRILFVDLSLVPLLKRIANQLITVEKIIVIGVPPQDRSSFKSVLASEGRSISHYEEWIAKKPTEFSWPELDENLAAGLCYTSGTTGNPKGALYSHRSQVLHAMTVGMADALGVKSSDTLLAVVPMFHANAWGLPYASLLVGAKMVLPGCHLKPTDLAQMIQEHRVTIGAGVPTLWMGLYQELKRKKYSIESLRALVVGGAAMPRSLIQAFETEFKVPVLHAWGMTELSPLGTTSGLESNVYETPDQIFDRKARQGNAAPGIEMRIIGEEGKEQPWDGVACGELQVKGAWVISSYYKDPSGDSQFTDDGWFKTGDVATIDPSGSMMILDRTKDLIKSGGEWISSVALENALMSHPQILEAAVIGIPDEKWSERPLALVVTKQELFQEIQMISLKDDLKQELGKRFVKFWVPERIELVREIPKTSVGKFDKKKLRQIFGSPFIQKDDSTQHSHQIPRFISP